MTLTARDLILAGSLAANLVLVGFLIGAGAKVIEREVARPVPVSVGGALNPRVLVEAVEGETRQQVFERFRAEGETAMAAFREIVESRRLLLEAASAEPFDPDAVYAALERVREVERGIQTRSDELVIEIIAGLPETERAVVVEHLQEREAWLREGGRRGRDGGWRRDRDRRDFDRTPDER